MNSSISEKYTIEKLIGNGTFSVVFKAKEKMCNRTVAIKALYKDTYQKGSIKYLKAETKAMGLLWGHPNIVAVHTVEPGDDNYIAYIVMEYVDNSDLRNFINRKQKNTLEDILCIGIDICNALSHAHSYNIIHRDIKPKNILLTKELSAKLSDFSVAQILEESGDYGIAGTKMYMAPEQYTGNYDYRVDIYATGLILLEMSLGKLPFDGLTPREIEWHKRTEDLAIPEVVSSCLRPVLQKAIKRDLRERYQTAADLRDELDKIRLGLYEDYVKELIEQDLNPAKFRTALKRKQTKLRLPLLVALNIEKDVKKYLETSEYNINQREIQEQSIRHYRLAKQYLFEEKIGNALSEIRKVVNLNVLDEKCAQLIDELYAEFTETLKNRVEQTHSRQIKVSTINESNYLRIVNLYKRNSQYDKMADTFLTVAKKFEVDDKAKQAKKCYKKAAKLYKKQAEKLSHNNSLEKVAEYYKKSAEAYRNIESCWRAKQVYEKAAQAYEHLAEIFKANQKWGKAGNCYFETIQLYENAKKTNKLDEVRKKTVEAYFQRALELYEQKKFEGAYRYCYASLRISTYIKEDCIVKAQAHKLLEKIESFFRSNNILTPPLDDITHVSTP